MPVMCVNKQFKSCNVVLENLFLCVITIIAVGI
jgi:hypothetical protein